MNDQIKHMELPKFLETLNDESKAEKLKIAIGNRFGCGYFGLHAGIEVSDFDNPPHQYKIQMNNFNSASGWATIGGARWDDKKGRWVISFKGKGLGKTGKHS